MQSNVIPLMRRATRWLGSFVLMGVCTLALALPSPKDIEAAVNAGRLTQAETMLREVLQDKPGSARAHYELGQVPCRPMVTSTVRESTDTTAAPSRPMPK